MGSRYFSTTWILVSAVTALLLWSLLTAYSLFWNLDNLHDEKIRLATAEARSNWNKDMAFRGWASQHGGVYVRTDARTPPNPYLDHLPQRDVRLEDGTELTLMNPAYMLRQLTEEYEASYGVKGKATGLLVLNPKNIPDEWEQHALVRIDSGEREVVEISTIDGAPYVRYIKAVMMEKSCEQCHGVLGYKAGDVRGGVSISVPLQPYFDADNTTKRSILFVHAAVWVIGVAGIMLFSAVVWGRQTESQKLLQCIEHNALHDVLTGLPNRQLFSDRLKQALERSRRDEEYHFAVCFIDLDRFKTVNDSYGHLLGDRILQEVGRRLLRCVRPSDTVARMGGDEFTLLLDSAESLEAAITIAERTLNALRTEIIIDGITLHTDASIGICSSSNVYTQPEQMIRDADTALYRAKEEGKGRIEFFNPEMHQRALTIMRLESDLHQATARNELQVHYQPIIDGHSGNIAGFEALLRWHHPELGTIPPAEFIPIAEAAGLIGGIGEWVLGCACRQVHDWNLQYGQCFFVSVNFSVKQIVDDDIVDTIRRALTSSHLPPELLHCEVTESILIRHKARAMRVFDEIRALGPRISIDDFGTGYSSLTYLHQFNFDILKIDRSFVHDMDNGGKGLQLVRMLMTLARDFQMKVIAEGVECKEQFHRLRAFNCGLLQGFYFLPPVPAQTLATLLDSGCAQDAQRLVAWQTDQQLSQQPA